MFTWPMWHRRYAQESSGDKLTQIRRKLPASNYRANLYTFRNGEQFEASAVSRWVKMREICKYSRNIDQLHQSKDKIESISKFPSSVIAFSKAAISFPEDDHVALSMDRRFGADDGNCSELIRNVQSPLGRLRLAHGNWTLHILWPETNERLIYIPHLLPPSIINIW